MDEAGRAAAASNPRPDHTRRDLKCQDIVLGVRAHRSTHRSVEIEYGVRTHSVTRESIPRMDRGNVGINRLREELGAKRLSAVYGIPRVRDQLFYQVVWLKFAIRREPCDQRVQLTGPRRRDLAPVHEYERARIFALGKEGT